MYEHYEIEPLYTSSPALQQQEPTELDERWTIDRAADLLEHYAEYVRDVKPDDIERHPYLPEVEYVASQLRDWFGRCEAGDRCSCPSDEKRVKCAHWIARDVPSDEISSYDAASLYCWTASPKQPEVDPLFEAAHYQEGRDLLPDGVKESDRG